MRYAVFHLPLVLIAAKRHYHQASKPEYCRVDRITLYFPSLFDTYNLLYIMRNFTGIKKAKSNALSFFYERRKVI